MESKLVSSCRMMHNLIKIHHMVWFKLLFHLYNTDISKGNTELISDMHYTNGIQKKSQ